MTDLPKKTTGVVSMNCIQCNQRVLGILIPTTTTGKLNTLDQIKRRLASAMRWYSLSIKLLRCDSVSIA